jgi:hypothetical protein
MLSEAKMMIDVAAGSQRLIRDPRKMPILL